MGGAAAKTFRSTLPGCKETLALFAFAAHAGLALADATRFGVDAEFSHLTNVNRAALDREERDDNALAVEAYAARSYLLSARSGMVVRGSVRAREFFDFGDLSSMALAGRAAWRFQPAPGFSSPFLELAAGAEAVKHRDSDIRDGFLVSGSASIGSHLTDRIRAEAGAGYERRDATQGNVYDLSNAKAWASLDYRITTRATLYGSATWMDGEQVFTLFNTANWPALYAYASAVAPDPVFAPAFGGSAPNAYRVDASTALYELGVNIATTGTQALDLGVSRFESRADRGDGRYEGSTFRVGYLYRFR